MQKPVKDKPQLSAILKKKIVQMEAWQKLINQFFSHITYLQALPKHLSVKKIPNFLYVNQLNAAIVFNCNI